jgi:hypothetical protein
MIRLILSRPSVTPLEKQNAFIQPDENIYGITQPDDSSYVITQQDDTIKHLWQCYHSANDYTM